MILILALLILIYVSSIGEDLRIDNGSYANFTILPGTGFDNYLVELGGNTAAAPFTIENLFLR